MPDAGEPEHETRTGRLLHNGHAVGAKLEVRNRFNGGWATGFEVAESVPDWDGDQLRYRVRRTCDRVILPSLFVAGDVRAVWPDR